MREANDFSVIGFILFLGLIGVAIYYAIWYYGKSDSILDDWARSYGFTFLRRERRTLNRGPFFWTTSRGQAVYYIEVRDRNGDVYNGWVRVGSWWFGILENKVEVQWESGPSRTRH